MESRKPMQNQERPNQAAGLNLADIYYILFRHKWKIIFLSVAGFLAAALVYFTVPASYTSEAKLFIRYILESRLPSGIAGDQQIKTLDTGGVNIINSEIEIIKSLDLAVQVAKAIGPERILGKGSLETNEFAAAVVLQRGLTVEVPPRSDILRIVFQHPNREIVQPVLTQLIDAYLLKHVEIHRSVGAFDDVLMKQTDALRTQLAQTEQELRRAKTNAGVMSIEDSKKAYTEELSKIRQELFNAQAELAGREAALAERQKLLPVKTEAPSEKPEADVPSDKMEEYRSVSGRLDSFRKQEQGLLAQYTEENSMVRGIRERIASVEKIQKKLEADYPKLTRIQLASSKPGGPVVDLSDDAAQISALQAKLKVLNSQMERLTTEAKVVNELEPAITELQRQKDLEETKYRHFSTSLEQARFDDTLGNGKMSNISVAQMPSPAARESRKTIKALSMIAIGGVVAGFALAFLIELFLDPSIRRPSEVESRLHLPLFLTIPRMRRNGRPALPAPAGPAAGQPGPGEGGAEPGTNQKSEVVPWHANGLATYYEALRDRLVTFFEVHNLLHKPKLIAVTGCGKGVGVTTIATGLAASLSETGDGNVLLVDMTTGQGAAHPFFKGKLGVGLADALSSGTRDNALVQENLYMVAESGKGGLLPRVLPRRFSNLVPKLKASDYDYIIFDMPPVSQISVTARLAGFMDTVLLVIESEKTDREVVKRATAMLAESKATVSAVLNKHRDYVPKRLSQDL
jgi:uncharacterized protein involved in exopolysaccharide biosynthesis/Mrp family chromosome partitioning ATPase